jgi:hypothetical protein
LPTNSWPHRPRTATRQSPFCARLGNRPVATLVPDITRGSFTVIILSSSLHAPCQSLYKLGTSQGVANIVRTVPSGYADGETRNFAYAQPRSAPAAPCFGPSLIWIARCLNPSRSRLSGVKSNDSTSVRSRSLTVKAQPERRCRHVVGTSMHAAFQRFSARCTTQPSWPRLTCRGR